MPDLVNVNRIDPSKSRKMGITSNGCHGDDEEGSNAGGCHVPDCDHMTTCVKDLIAVALPLVLLHSCSAVSCFSLLSFPGICVGEITKIF